MVVAVLAVLAIIIWRLFSAVVGAINAALLQSTDPLIQLQVRVHDAQRRRLRERHAVHAIARCAEPPPHEPS